MRAVKGSVVSSRPVSFSKAAAILARFAAAENGARPETAAYLRRASTAFDELVQFHREIKAARRTPEIQVPREEEDGGRDGFKEKKRRKKKEERVGLEDGGERVALGGLRGELGALDGRDLMVDESKHGGGDKFELEERTDEKRKKKKRKRCAEEEEKNSLERKEEQVDEERHGKNKKKRKKNKEKGGEKRKEFE